MGHQNQALSLADLHMHTTASDGMLSPQALVNAVLGLQMRMDEPLLRVIAVTDHDTLAGAWTAIEYKNSFHPDADLQIIAGSEISTADGHVLALDIREDIPKAMSALDTITAIHEQGGIAIAAHPYAYVPMMPGLRGIRSLIADPLVGVALDAIEVRNANPTEALNNHYTQWVNSRNCRRPEVGGSDSHFLSAIARAATIFPGETAAELQKAIREGTTRAWGSVYGPLTLFEYLRERKLWRRFCQKDTITRIVPDLGR